jgi:hypothetical protein
MFVVTALAVKMTAEAVTTNYSPNLRGYPSPLFAGSEGYPNLSRR